MAVTEITAVKSPDVNALSGAVTLTAATSATDGFVCDFDGKDYKTAFIVENTNDSANKTITIKAGDSKRASANDLVFSITKSKKYFFTLDSALFKKVTGATAGKVVIIPESTDIKISVIELT